MKTKYNTTITALLDTLKEISKELELNDSYSLNRDFFFEIIRFIGETYVIINKFENLNQYKYNDYKLFNIEISITKERLRNIIEKINAEKLTIDKTNVINLKNYDNHNKKTYNKSVNKNKLDVLRLLEDCSGVINLDNSTKYRTKRIPYDRLTDEEKQEVFELVKQSNDIPYFKLVLDLNEFRIFSSNVTVIKLVEGNRVIGLYVPIKILTGKYKGFYKSPIMFLNLSHRGKGYGKELLEKYFSNRKGVRWIDNTDKRKQLLFSSFGFTKTEDQAVNYDDITLGTFWVKNN